MCFNTQPPEGGWLRRWGKSFPTPMFQHTAARRRLDVAIAAGEIGKQFQHTAARRRLARFWRFPYQSSRFQHTAARRRLGRWQRRLDGLCRFNTQPPEGGWRYFCSRVRYGLQFQHTAARRRLGLLPHVLQRLCSFNTQPPEGGWGCTMRPHCWQNCFNTQPPEGGWEHISQHLFEYLTFQHTAARRRLAPKSCGGWGIIIQFQHTAARRRLAT